MSEVLVILPLLLPLAAAGISLAAPHKRGVQRTTGIIGTSALLAVGAALLWQVRDGTILTMSMGNWPAPYGIIFVADALAAIMVFVTGIIGLAAAIYSARDVDAGRERYGHYPLMHILLMGVCGAFLTGDLFNLFVWFEVLLIASFVLLTLGGTRGQMEAAIKYVVINLFSSALFLAAVGLTYGLVGTVNMADLAVKLAATPHTGLVTAIAMLFLISFGIKSAVFPLYFWLPASYHTPPAVVSALFAALLTKVGVYALLRTFTLIFTQDVAYTHTILLVVAVVTMLMGALGAIAQSDLRRTLSYQVIAAIGYMVLGLALYTPMALTGAIFYIFHDIVVKANLFFLSGVVYHLHGTYRMERLGGLAKSHPGLAILFLISALSLAGVPPLSGFWAKFLIVLAGLDATAYIAVTVALVAGLLTLYSMVKIWNEVFWKARPEETEAPKVLRLADRASLLGPTLILSAVTIGIGIAPALLFDLAKLAADQLMDPTAYLEAVLGASP